MTRARRSRRAGSRCPSLRPPHVAVHSIEPLHEAMLDELLELHHQGRRADRHPKASQAGLCFGEASPGSGARPLEITKHDLQGIGQLDLAMAAAMLTGDLGVLLRHAQDTTPCSHGCQLAGLTLAVDLN